MNQDSSGTLWHTTIYQLEMDQDNFQMMKKCMESYITQRLKSRDRQRTEGSKKQVRALEPIRFDYKIISEYEIVESRIRTRVN